MHYKEVACLLLEILSINSEKYNFEMNLLKKNNILIFSKKIPCLMNHITVFIK